MTVCLVWLVLSSFGENPEEYVKKVPLEVKIIKKASFPALITEGHAIPALKHYYVEFKGRQKWNYVKGHKLNKNKSWIDSEDCVTVSKEVGEGML